MRVVSVHRLEYTRALIALGAVAFSDSQRILKLAEEALSAWPPLSG